MSTDSRFDADLAKWGSTMHALRRDRTARAARRLLLLAVGLLLLILLVDGAHADSVRLHDQAGTPTGTVTLDQIAELDGPAATALAPTVVVTLAPGQTRTTVTLAQVRTALDGAGAHWGRLTLKGFTRCQVTRLTQRAEPVIEADRDAAVNVDRPVSIDTPSVLGGQIKQTLADLAGLDAADLIVTFADRDREAAGRSVLTDRYEIEPMSRAPLGRVPLRVYRYEGDRPVETLTLTATVRQRAMALVAGRTMRRGEVFGPDDLTLREVMIERAGHDPLTDHALVIGQIAAKPIAAGDRITAASLRSQVLVKRGEWVTVRVLAGGLVLRGKAKALADGSRGDVIAVRSESSLELFNAEVIGRGLAVVTTHLGAAGEPTQEMASR